MTAPNPAVQIQGQGAISADQANTYLQACTSVAQARGVIGLSNMMLYLEGISSPGDGGQGPFYWNGTSTAADDNGVSTIAPSGAGSTGRWIRLFLVPNDGLEPGTFTNATVVVGSSGNITSITDGGGGGGFTPVVGVVISEGD